MTQLQNEVRDKTPEEIQEVGCPLETPADTVAPYRYDPREDLWRDVVRVGLGQLVAVDEVLGAARKVLEEYDFLFGLGFSQPEVPETFYDHDPHAETQA